MNKNKSVWLVYDLQRFAKAVGYYERYLDYFTKAGFKAELVFVEILVNTEGLFFYNGAIVEPPDVAVFRTYNLELTAALERRGVKVFNNSRVAEICNDKYKTYEAIQAADIEIPLTKIYNASNYEERIDEQSFPAVMKSLNGHGGTEVFWITNRDDIKPHLIEIEGRDFILQNPVKTLGRDLRIYVIGKEIVASVIRNNQNDFRSNFSLGGEAKPYALGAYERKIAEKIMGLFEFGMVGIDFIFEGERPVFNEIEDVVGARMLYNCTDIDIVKLYTQFIISHAD